MGALAAFYYMTVPGQERMETDQTERFLPFAFAKSKWKMKSLHADKYSKQAGSIHIKNVFFFPFLYP